MRAPFEGCIEGESAGSLKENIQGKRLLSIGRRGKLLLFHLDDGSILTVHLRMTGRLTLISPEEDEEGPHTRLIVYFEQAMILRFDDPRKFGRVRRFPNQKVLLGSVKIGPEPLDDDFQVDSLIKLLQGRRRPIKSLLLDQTIIAGLGNIYADESLFRAGIKPTRPSGSINRSEASALWKAMRTVLLEGIRYKGTTLRDYVDGDGRPGEFATRLKAYGREGEPCPQCGEPIQREKIGGRSSFYCLACQK